MTFLKREEARGTSVCLDSPSESDEDAKLVNEEEEVVEEEEVEGRKNILKFVAASFSWQRGNCNVLHSLDLVIPSAALTVIIGKIGVKLNLNRKRKIYSGIKRGDYRNRNRTSYLFLKKVRPAAERHLWSRQSWRKCSRARGPGSSTRRRNILNTPSFPSIPGFSTPQENLGNSKENSFFIKIIFKLHLFPVLQTKYLISILNLPHLVKDNILFGRPYKEKRYIKTLEACDIQHDIGNFNI